MSAKDSLTQEDIKNWGVNLLIFSQPALLAGLLAFCVALSGNTQLTQFAVVAAISMGVHTFLNSLIDLLGKYRAGSTTVALVTTPAQLG